METRGWKLCIFFGLLSVALAKDASLPVPGAREDETIFSEYTLMHDSKSHLFSSCFDELNTVEATLHAIEVDEGKEYIRYLIDSDAEVTWEDVEGVYDTIACAFDANEAGSLMFKYSNGVCSLATEGVYNPKDASCDGEEVFIISPLDICFTSLGTEETGHQYYTGLCETNCDSAGILTDKNGLQVESYSTPSEVLECCTEDITPCLEFVTPEALPCDADRICYFMGMTLPSALPGEGFEKLLGNSALFNENSADPFLVNVKYKDGSWYHFPDEVLVNDDEFESGPPPTDSLIGLNVNGKLEAITENTKVSVVCQGGEELTPCSE